MPMRLPTTRARYHDPRHDQPRPPHRPPARPSPRQPPRSIRDPPAAPPLPRGPRRDRTGTVAPDMTARQIEGEHATLVDVLRAAGRVNAEVEASVEPAAGGRSRSSLT